MSRQNPRSRSLRSNITRRELGRRSAAFAAAAAVAQLGACASPEPAVTSRPASRSSSVGYDYIVVGSGAGGGPLAANLARAGRRVLVIEAGSADAGGLTYSVPAFYAASTDDPSMQWNYFVRHWDKPPAQDSKYSPAQHGIWYPRAGTLGGCTAHNAMITVYPDDADWDAIAAAIGDASWSSAQMRRYFERLEACRYRPRWRDAIYNWSGHGYDGWLPTSEADPSLLLRDEKLIELARAAGEAVGFGGVIDNIVHGLLDPNDVRSNVHRREGLFLTPLAVRDGTRFGTRDYLLKTQRELPDNLTIITNALVTRVLFEGTRAVGVEYIEQAHVYRGDPRSVRSVPLAALAARRRTIRTEGDVILAAGAFNSPQLLMLSGIGPKTHLAAHKIPVVVDRPGVGANLQDRYEVGVVSRLPSPFQSLQDCKMIPPAAGSAPDPCLDEWKTDPESIYGTNGVVIGIVRRSRPERTTPDLYIFGFPGAFRGYYPGWSAEAVQKDHFTWAILKAHTNNTAGRVRLRSADPRDTPDIAFHYFEEGNDESGEDLDAVVAGVEFVRTLNQRLQTMTPEEVIPGPKIRTSKEIADFVRREAWGHHASCTNKMGPASDPMAVVDSAFRVHGTQGLRVVDASVFPRIPGFFIVTAVYMISEKATDVILAT